MTWRQTKSDPASFSSTVTDAALICVGNTPDDSDSFSNSMTNGADTSTLYPHHLSDAGNAVWELGRIAVVSDNDEAQPHPTQ